MGRTLLLLIVAVALPACGGSGSGSDPAPRPYRLGFTPWPYDATAEAIEWTFATIGTDGDLVSEHLEEGVPWVEMKAGQPLPAPYLAALQDRISRKPPGQRVLVQINALNTARTGLAPEWAMSGGTTLPAPWNGYALDHPDVKAAYLAYALKIVDLFQPDFLGIGVEVNLLLRNEPAKWAAYVALHAYVYAEIKKVHPALPVSASFFCVPFFPEWSSGDNLAVQQAGLADLLPSLDIVAWSAHPFMSALLAETFPDDYFDRLFAYSPKPVAVSESSYPAQTWTTLTGPTLVFRGTPEKQDRFLKLMLEACDRNRARFAVWFSIRDYDALWAGALGGSPEALTWRDTGLYDENGAPRPARDTWRAALAIPCSGP